MERTGFTLIEVVIVIAIIAVLAVIAVPNLLRSRTQSNEAAAIENVRAIASAQVTYHVAKKEYGDFTALSSTGDGPSYLDASWSEGCTRQGYRFSLTGVGAETFTCFADPQTPGSTGGRYFRADASGLIRWSTSGRPAADAPSL